MRATVVAAVTWACMLAPPASAQVSLDRVDELTRLGRTEQARALLMRWWEQDRPSAVRRDLQRGFWLRGRLTVDPLQADLDYRRLAIEYPGGPFSDAALLRLAQSAQARGDLQAAALHLRRLRTEYPSASAVREADAWLALVGPLPDPDPPRPAVATPPPAGEPPPSAVSRPPVAPAAEAEPAGAWAIQFGAFAEAGRAHTVLGELGAAGVEGRLVVVEGSPLVRVRSGLWATHDEAAAAAERLRERGFTVVVVRDADRERPVG